MLRSITLVACVTVLGACQDRGAASETKPAAAAPPAVALAAGVEAEFGPVVAMLPAGVEPSRVDDGYVLPGMLVWIEERTPVHVAELPLSGLELGAWVDSMQLARDSAGIPKTEHDFEYRVGPKEPFKVGAFEGWQLTPDAGDCLSREAYFVVGTRRVMAGWCVDGIGDLTVAQREELVRAFIATFKPRAGTG